MNLYFFMAAMAVYVCSAAGYIVYFLRPEYKKGATATIGFRLAVAGLVLHIAYFILRWHEAGRVPATNFFEAVNFLAMGMVLVFLIMEFRFRIAALGSFMLPLIIILMTPAFMVSGRIEEISPVLKSGWLGIHTSFAVIGDAAFAFAFIVAIMYLMQERQLKTKQIGTIFHRLPSLDVLDTLSYKAISFGWPLFTLGMVTGSIWAESAWGSYWSWDPKETWSLITWIIYLAILHLRTLGWRGRKMAYLSIVGFVFVLVSFFVISRVGTGRHVF